MYFISSGFKTIYLSLYPAAADKKEREAPTMTQPDDWQASKRNMKERNTFMFNNELLADVHFIVGSGSTQHRIPAHKYMLVTGSSVFYAMFHGELAETSQEISIPDVEPQAFLNLLRWVLGWMEELVSRSSFAQIIKWSYSIHNLNMQIMSS